MLPSRPRASKRSSSKVAAGRSGNMRPYRPPSVTGASTVRPGARHRSRAGWAVRGRVAVGIMFDSYQLTARISSTDLSGADPSAVAWTRSLGDELLQQRLHSPEGLELTAECKAICELRWPPVADHGLTAGVPDEKSQRQIVTNGGIRLHQGCARPRIAKDHQLLVGELESGLASSSSVVDAGEYADPPQAERRDHAVDRFRHAVGALAGCQRHCAIHFDPC